MSATRLTEALGRDDAGRASKDKTSCDERACGSSGTHSARIRTATVRLDLRVTQPAFDDPTPSWLFGRWRLMRSDPSLDFGPGVRMEFQRGGHLRYILSVDGRELVVPLVYRTTGDLLETDNPAASHVMSTRFTLGAGDMLILDFAGAQAIFVRER